MKRSTDRILTTHTGSLPRQPALTAALQRRDEGNGPDGDLDGLIRDGVLDVVHRQREAGVSVVNDGEASKISYATYVKERLDGFGGQSSPRGSSPDFEEFPEYVESVSTPGAPMSACVAPIAYRDLDAVHIDIANLKAALGQDGDGIADAFMSAASPGVISARFENQFYPDHEAYIYALADAMKSEYDEIHRAGFVLQLDCPDLAADRHRHPTLDAYRRQIALHIEAINHATREIPSDAMRLHLCWGNFEGPHTHDVPLSDIVDLVLTARPAGLSFEAANPRHAHEWTVWKETPLPDGKLLIPGVLDSTTNYVEHPDLICQRLLTFAKLVGREHVIAGSDCGFSTFATSPTVHPTVTWAKLAAMAEGARRASERLWERPAA